MIYEAQTGVNHVVLLSEYDAANPEHTRSVTVRCKLCGRPTETEAFFNKVFHGHCICPSCDRELKAQEEAERHNALQTPEKRFRRLAPRSFVEGPSKTDPGRLGFPREALKKALDWDPKGLGLFINGPTGSCKSRILFELIRRLIVQDRLDVEVLHGGDFRQRLIDAYRAEQSKILMDRWCKVAILAWDDFGQDALKPGMETDLRYIIDYRYREGLPLLVTTQFTPELLTQRLSGGDAAREQVCASIIRRICERSHIITL